MLSDCGHLPQEEFPQETALLIRNMLDGVISSQAEKRPAPKQETEAPPRRPLKMRRLFDYWNLGSVLIIITLKLLQFSAISESARKRTAGARSRASS